MARILVAEDESALSALIERVLRREGHEIIFTADGDEAVRLFTEFSPDLLITDVLLPSQTGLEVAQHCWEIDPELPVLFTSGYSLHDVQSAGISGEAILPKPFVPSDLAIRVRDLLAHGRRR